MFGCFMDVVSLAMAKQAATVQSLQLQVQLVWYMHTCSQATSGRHLVARCPQLSLSHSDACASTGTERARLWRNEDFFLHAASLAGGLLFALRGYGWWVK